MPVGIKVGFSKKTNIFYFKNIDPILTTRSSCHVGLTKKCHKPFLRTFYKQYLFFSIANSAMSKIEVKYFDFVG